MFKKYVVPVLAIIGFISAVRVVFLGSKAPPLAPVLVAPPAPPFERFVAGTAIFESSSENVQLGSHRSGVIEAVHVQVGDSVPGGSQLFTVDHRDLDADKLVREANVKLAQAEVRQAQAERDNAKSLHERALVLRSTSALSKETLDQRYFALQAAEAVLSRSQSQLTLREAELKVTETEIDRSTVRAPFDGSVLQLRARPGAFAAAGASTEALALFGNTKLLRVRVDIDENDAWRFKPNTRAVAFVRGNRSLSAKLNFVRIEPYVLPKRSLTGLSTERVDTRVLQVLYDIEKPSFDLYIGQLLEVFIEQGT